MIFKDIKNYLSTQRGIKTSNDWYQVVKDKFGIELMDPDGWDRQNFQFSFFIEKIDSNEFIDRLEISTLKFNI